MKHISEISAFYKLMTETDSIYEQVQKQSGLPIAEFWCLTAVRLDGCICQSEISRVMHMNRQTVNSALRHLEDKHFLILTTLPENRRIKKISLTKEGLAFARIHVDRLAKFENEAWMKLSPEERKSLYDSTAHFNEVFRTIVAEEFKTGESL